MNNPSVKDDRDTKKEGQLPWSALPLSWEWPARDEEWVILKAVTKAHRRIKFLLQEWQHQVANGS